MAEAEVIAQGSVDDADRHGDEGPAAVADGGAGAARADVVVVCHVDVEDEFFGEWSEGGRFTDGFAVARVRAVDRADFETGGYLLDALFAEARGRLVGRVWEGGGKDIQV